MAGRSVFKIVMQFALTLIALSAVVTPAKAQTFDSGSTGADGAFNPTCPPGPLTCTVTLQIPESGIFNFTTITIPFGVTVRFTRNSRNTPVMMLAAGDVVIDGVIRLDGSGSGGAVAGGAVALPGRGGPGGFDGGLGGHASTFLLSMNGSPGLGPGGGAGGDSSQTGSSADGAGGGFAVTGVSVGSTPGGTAYGVHTLFPIIGGSGGGGGAGDAISDGAGGGGGGGALLLASSGTITCDGFNIGGIQACITAFGGRSSSQGAASSGGQGSGGGIRLVANTITVPTTGERFYVRRDFFVSQPPTAGLGRVRLEAFNINYPGVPTDYSRGIPGPLTFPNVKIASVGGVAAPSNPFGTFLDNTDVIVDPATPNPLTVNLAASNVPLGTVVELTAVTDGVPLPTTATSTPLAGTVASSTATASLTLPAGKSVITVTATFAAAP